jgi:5'-nucleotidase
MDRIVSGGGRKQLAAFVAAVAIALGVIVVPTAAQAELCFNQPGVTACVAPEFRAFWEKNGGLPVFGYPQDSAKQENGYLVQYFERQRLELHPENAAPYGILLGRINDDALTKEGRSWLDFPKNTQINGQCQLFGETQQTICGEFYHYWISHGLDLGDPGVSYRESLGLWGLPLSPPQMEINLDGGNVLTQHFERARFEMHTINNRPQIQLTRLGVEVTPLLMKIIAVNDFHGQLSADRMVANRRAGGAAYLAAYINERRARVRESLLVHAGDSVGASPLVSALFQDQPTMEFMNMMKFDVGTSGNHEFDEGIGEYKRLVEGGCHPTAGCWSGANFSYLTSNVIDTKTGKTIFPAYKIVNVNGARIGFVGAVLKDTPTIVTPSGVAGLEFLDEAESINKAVGELHQQGVHAIVVLIHQGGFQAGNVPTGQLSGAIVDIVNKLDPDIDIVASGHTHAFTNTTINGKLITQAFSYSTAFADIDILYDRAKRDIVDKKAEIVTTFNDGVTPDPAVAALVKKYEDLAAPLANRVVGTAAAALPNDRGAAVDTGLGSLIADAQRDKMGTQFAFMNPGGIRASLDAGEVTYGELFSVQPFGNNLVKMNLTGEQIYALLNRQWQPQTDGSLIVRILQISGLSYTYVDANPIGSKVVEVRGADGQPIDRAASYSVTVNSFLADGGDGFMVLRQGTNREGGPVDLDALVDYIGKLPQPFSPPAPGRIVKQ